MKKIQIEDEILYVDYLGHTDNGYRDNGIGEMLHMDSLKSALQPVVKVGKLLKEGLKEAKPDEAELTLQLQLAVSEDALAFALVKAGAEAHLSLKFVWKKEDMENMPM